MSTLNLSFEEELSICNSHVSTFSLGVSRTILVSSFLEIYAITCAVACPFMTVFGAI